MMLRIFIATLILTGFTLGAGAQELTDRDREILDQVLNYHKTNQECPDRGSSIEAYELIKFEEEYGTVRVIMVSCAFHAYQVSWVAYSAGEDHEFQDISLLSFPSTTDGEKWTATKFLMTPQWQADTKTLQTFYKGRGIGDCGGYSAYRWKDGSFFLVSSNYQVCCWDEEDFETRAECKKLKGKYPVSIENWPLVFSYEGG